MSKIDKKTGSGRIAGTPNRLTASIKDNIIQVFGRLGGIEGMANWAMENQTQFYQIYAKLLPTDVKAEVVLSGSIEVNQRVKLSREEWLASLLVK